MMITLIRSILCLIISVSASEVIVDFDPTLFTLLGVDVSDDLAVASLTRTHLNISALTVSHGSGPAFATCRSAKRLVNSLPDLKNIPLECGGGYTKNVLFREEKFSRHAAVELIREKTLASKSLLDGGGVTWLALGPGTHFASALYHYPNLATYIREVVLVGSRLDGGWEVNTNADISAFSFLLNATSVPR